MVHHTRKAVDGIWTIVKGYPFNRRITADTPINLTGTAKGNGAVGGVTHVIGIFANLSGRKTLCDMVFSGKYNYAEIMQNWSETAGVPAQNPTHYGWAVEIAAYEPKSTPKKHSMLSRFTHENVVMTLGKYGRIVVYSGASL
ncbi:alkaline phosphatase PhoX [Psychrobacillus sp. NPDC058041]|uniref:alkaline phosphatase PhoX n=1 Tax=Psychrobacillus sp. NPDC058041 TaxID=3346310 RepID=UPI0036DE73BD